MRSVGYSLLTLASAKHSRAAEGMLQSTRQEYKRADSHSTQEKQQSSVSHCNVTLHTIGCDRVSTCRNKQAHNGNPRLSFEQDTAALHTQSMKHTKYKLLDGNLQMHCQCCKSWQLRTVLTKQTASLGGCKPCLILHHLGLTLLLLALLLACNLCSNATVGAPQHC